MDKISGILPGSSRVTSVDLNAASPVRPGTPAFGSPTGRSTANQMQRSSATMVNPNSIDVPRWKAKEDMHAEIAKRVSDGFFRKNITEAPAEPVDGPIDMEKYDGVMMVPFTYDANGKVELPEPELQSIPDAYEGIDTVA
ncbi:MAG: hypothetical protein SGJ18_05555 [Pseudomonadota bacterium]|nr:hypothetical protein [Pseudomonadota bacterium]